ncbi:MAG: pilus assembly protein [Acidobacteriaceae bacterium]|nr:pilus assembly protein [Acidobacteriaceae bacterium]
MLAHRQDGRITIAAHRRSRRERGASLVEFALVLIPLLGLIFGIIGISWIIFAQNTIQEAVREGVRYGITGGDPSSGTGLNAQIQQVVQNYSVGFVTDPSNIVINYYSPSDLTTPITDASADSGGNVLQVSASVSIRGVILIVRPDAGITLTATASDVMENSPEGGPPPL